MTRRVSADHASRMAIASRGNRDEIIAAYVTRLRDSELGRERMSRGHLLRGLSIDELMRHPLLKTVRQPMVRGCGLPRRAGVKQGSSPSGAVGRAVTVTTLRNLKARSTAISSSSTAPHAAEQLEDVCHGLAS